jgi:uncharacterized protein YndB with AHSA1/START domain
MHALEVTTPSDLEIRMTRVFNAPRPLVFEAMWRPELLKRWLLGPEGWEMHLCDVDFRVGGSYRYGWRHLEKGQAFGFQGRFLELAEPERIVSTEKFLDDPRPGESVNTLVLTESGGKTMLTLTMKLDSKEARDAVLATGMTDGVGISYDRLDGILAELE